MKLGILKSLGHNIADSLASGIGLMIGIYAMDVFAEAAGEDEGFLVVDFLAGTTTAATASADLRKAIGLYRDALPDLCQRHGVQREELATLTVRYGTDRVYGRHFTVTVKGTDGRGSTERYVGVPGRRFGRGHGRTADV
jgi:hypothetical protein